MTFLIINILFITLFVSFCCFSIGSILLRYLDINRKYLSILLGVSVVTIFANTLFFFNFSISTIRYSILLLFALSVLLNLFKFKNIDLSEFKKIVFDQILIIIFFLLTVTFYGEQFYIFRGNHYDTINYTAMSLLASNFSYAEIIGLSISNESSFFADFSQKFVRDRPTISIFISLLYLPKILDIFLVNYLFKIFFLICLQQSVSFFLYHFNPNLTRIKLFLISNIFVFSFFSFYVFEIDAFSQIGSFGISIVFISLIVFNYPNRFDKNYLLLLSIISSAFFLIYPEQAIIYFILLSIFLCFKNFKLFFNNFIIFFPLILIFTLPSFQIYEFLFKQIMFSSSFSGDWWGYFGGFILGSKNIILDENSVKLIKETISNKSKYESVKYIFKMNSEFYNRSFILNILPSLSGIYFIDVIKNYNNLAYIFISFLLNVLIIYFIYKNIIYIFKTSNDFSLFLRIFIIFFVTLSVITLLYYNLWILIKFYFYFSFLIFFLIVKKIDTNDNNKNKYQNYNYFILIFILIFPIYKYGNFNNGIGTLDSMPSILKKNFKLNNNLVIDKKLIKNCTEIYIIKKNKILDNFVAAKLIYYKKDYKFIDKIKKIKKCQI